MATNDTGLEIMVREVWNEVSVKLTKYRHGVSTLDCPLAHRSYTDSFYPIKIHGALSYSIFFGGSQRHKVIEQVCCDMLEASENAPEHVQLLDRVLSNLLECKIVTVDESEDVIGSAYCLLSRLPTQPPHLLEVPRQGCHQFAQYFHPSHTTGLGFTGSNNSWEDVRVVRYMNTNLARIALSFASPHVHYYGVGGPVFSQGKQSREINPILQAYVNLLAELWEMATRISDEASDTAVTFHWFIVKAFLATCWQRSATLLSWYCLERQLEDGFHFTQINHILLREVPTRSEGQGIVGESSAQVTPYMCAWAYELLRRDRAAATMDLRSFYLSFNRLFGQWPARCKNGRVCDGKSPMNCERFVGATILNQSQHDETCSRNCSKFFWEEESYRSASGGRAVCIESSAQALRYCQASERTLAISHVWSHGQGGRPEGKLVHNQVGGLNACLHARYLKIARDFDCDSYWIDTACIPEDHELRQESISNINKIFLTSKVVIVCDRDCMAIDVANLTVEVAESVLATILVCDWNVRAWTFLEALRASHLLPSESERMSPRYFNDWVQDGRGFLNTEEAAVSLSYRQASRPGDDLVIWSLLTGHEKFDDAATMWRSKSHGWKERVRSGSLVSSVPRIIGMQGLSWAPRQPSCPHDEGMAYLPSTSFNYTRVAIVKKDGLLGTWGVHIFGVQAISDDALQPFQREVLQMITKSAWSKRNFKVIALLQPLRELIPAAFAPLATNYRGSVRGPLFGVCATDDEQCWAWIGVYHWNNKDFLPQFEERSILLC